MATTFGNVTRTLSPDGKSVTISGQADGVVSTPVTVTEVTTASDGTTDTENLTGTSSVAGKLPVKITAVSDTLGRTWTIAADGQSASTP